MIAADHFQPWVPAQGHSVFVWSWMAALGATTTRLTFGPGVTCPLFRFHPAIVAPAAATQAATAKVTEQAVYNWIKSGKLTTVKFGSAHRIPAAEFQRVMREGVPEDNGEKLTPDLASA